MRSPLGPSALSSFDVLDLLEPQSSEASEACVAWVGPFVSTRMPLAMVKDSCIVTELVPFLRLEKCLDPDLPFADLQASPRS